MASALNPKLRLYEDIYNDKGYSSTNHISNALQAKSDVLSPIVTHLYGSDKNYGSGNFPLSFVTEGMNNFKVMKSMDYTYSVLGRPKKTSIIAKTNYKAGEQPGVGRTRFYIYFADRWFHKSLVISSPNKVQARIMADPIQEGAMWRFECQLVDPTATAFVPLKELQAGSVWAGIIATVGMEDSRGVEHRTYSPGKATNQLTLVRETYQYKGNVTNKVMVVEIKTEAQTFSYWCEWELYQLNLRWKEKCETQLWYSIYNKDENGIIHLTDDDSGAPIPMGAGLLQQIPNEDSYSFLSINKLESIITDVFYNATDAYKVEVDIWTGMGGLREADRAMKAASAGFVLVDSKQVNGPANSNSMVFGSYFSVYKHIDGHTVTFRHLPLLDRGAIADASPKHPITGFPLESYSMYIIDNSVYDGDKNLQYLVEEGRENIVKVVPGMAAGPKGYANTMWAANDRDSGSVQWMKSQGIQLKKPTNCVKVFCKIS